MAPGRLLLALACAGCNQVWGIGDTRPLPPDGPRPDVSPTVDQDLDGVVDDVDNCPGIYNPDQASADGDAVGDVCDPHPATPGDVIVVRSVFQQGFDGWTPDSVANWQVADGAATPIGTADAIDARLSRTLTVALPTIELGFHVVDYGADQTPSRANTLQLELDAPNDGAYCQLDNQGGGGPLFTSYLYYISYLRGGTGFPAIAPGSVARYVHMRDATGVTCTINGTPLHSDLGPQTAPALFNAILHVQGAQIAIDYVVIYGVTS